jgi:5'-methylthioadenosine phosphorylase
VTDTIGVIGGSGLYRLLDDVTTTEVETPYGPPSGPLTVVRIPTADGADGAGGERTVVFLARHGPRHSVPPHRINYRANLWALHEAGVTRVLGPAACGSLRGDRHPGDLVVCDQLVDDTSGRSGTYFDGPVVNHIAFADPYCSQLGNVLGAAAAEENMPVHRGGTVVVIDGPRFATRAESATYRRLGYDVINMTQAPEVALARELGMCYATVALVTDYDSGVDDRPEVAPVSQGEVFAVFEANVDRLRRVLLRAVAQVGARTCQCADATNGVMPTPSRER